MVHCRTSSTQACSIASLNSTGLCSSSLNLNNQAIPCRTGQQREFWFDHCFPFGSSSASSTSGMVSAAVRDIWQVQDVSPIAKVQDDFNVFRNPAPDSSYPYDRDSMLELIESTLVPWHPEKGDKHFFSITTFIGLL